jgi:phytoene dehydrogenase-like protein
MSTAKSAYVVGSGPNGLTAAIMLARAGVRTTVLEAQSTIGGGTRSAELTLRGFHHDVCSAVHPLGISSPAFRSFPLAEHGLEWVQPPVPLAHPLDNEPPALLMRSIDRTAESLGRDAVAWRATLAPIVREWDVIVPGILRPPVRVPRHPFALAPLGVLAPWPAASAARFLFRTERARALFAGVAAHAVIPLERTPSGAFGWVLTAAGHAVGWPVPRGGSQAIANALASYFRSLGGEIVAETPVRSLDEVRDRDMVLLDVTPRQLLEIAGDRLTPKYRNKLRSFRYGPGVFKMDWALDGPIPWAAPECSQAATVHLGGTLDEIAEAERAPWEGYVPERPFVLLAQPSLFDPSRAPAGKHTAWAYCHVQNGSIVDMSERIEAQVERFAPGFGSRILARVCMNTAELQGRDENLQGGDIGGGAVLLRQLLFRPTASLYRTSAKGVYLCSSSTPPGGGVHGMCGYHAAVCALKDSGLQVV